MAQIREATTSTLVFEGTPEQCVLLAAGLDGVVLDGVGTTMNARNTFDAAVAAVEIAEREEMLQAPVDPELQPYVDAELEAFGELHASVEANRPDVLAAVEAARAAREEDVDA